MRHFLKNEAGGTVILMAVLCSVAIIILSLSFNVYMTSQISYAAKIRESFKMVNAIEEASKTVKSQWDRFAADPANWTAGNPDPVKIQVRMNNPANWVPLASCVAGCPVGAPLLMCFDNEIGTAPYCFYGAAGSTYSTQLDYKLLSPRKFELTRTEKLVARFDRFFHRSMFRAIMKKSSLAYLAAQSSFIPESEAAVIVRANDTVSGAAINCVPGGNPKPVGCFSCGLAAGNPCVSIYTCPQSFPGCSTFTGTATANSFTQNFVIVTTNQ